MQVTPIVEALAKLRGTYDQPISDMAIIRQTLSGRAARLGAVDMPPILNENQRQVFLGNIDDLTEFLNGEDGADAIELLMNAFAAFVEARKRSREPQAPSEPE